MQSAIQRRSLRSAQAPVYLFEGGVDLMLAYRVRRGLPLTRELGLGEFERLDLALLLWIDLRRPACAAAAIGFTFFNLLLDARLRVDQAFSGISHLLRIQDRQRK